MPHLIKYRALLADVGLVLVFSSLHVFDLSIRPHPPGIGWLWPLLLSVPATFALLVRRKWPWAATIIPLAVATALTLMHTTIGALNLVILVGVYSVCARGSLRAAVLVSLLALAYPASQMVGLTVAEAVLNISGALVNLVMIVGWGRAMRVGRLRADQLERTVSLLDQARDQIAADAAVVERTRIAREFHDIVSHNLSVVALRAGVARALLDRDPGHARETLRELERTSSAALDEMRTLLGALRDDGEGHPGSGAKETSGWQPTPGLDRVDALVDSVRESSVSWRVERRGAIRELRSGVEMTAFRIVQEAVTNVLKHAGPGYARVLLDYGTGALHVEITNHTEDPALAAARGHLRVVATSGHGLVGLRERVALLGGTLTAHPIPGGFHLAAVLPCPEPADLENA